MQDATGVPAADTSLERGLTGSNAPRDVCFSTQLSESVDTDRRDEDIGLPAPFGENVARFNRDRKNLQEDVTKPNPKGADHHGEGKDHAAPPWWREHDWICSPRQRFEAGEDHYGFEVDAGSAVSASSLRKSSVSSLNLFGCSIIGACPHSSIK